MPLRYIVSLIVVPLLPLVLLTASNVSFGATGDVIPPETEKSIIESPAERKMEETISFMLPFEAENENAVIEKLSKFSLRITNDKEHWDFKFLPKTYTLKPISYVVFGDTTIPLPEDNTVTLFPTIKRYSLAIPKKVLVEYIQNNIEAKVNHEKKDVTIKKENGNIIFEGAAENGQTVDRLALMKAMEKAVQDNIDNVRTPIQYQNGVVHTIGLEDLHIQELIGEGISDFSGSPSNRVHNINVGMKQFNGAVIKKGDTFSFVQHLGPVDDAHGFLPELVIKGPDTIPEFGGGLCQVSTTMFRAALFSGLPINERRNHSYAVQYYVWPLGWGFDATIYIGAVDLKFTNDTPGDILVQAYTEKSRAYYKFYGMKDNRTILINGPFITGHRSPPPPVEEPTDTLAPGVKKLKEKAHAGLSAYFTRSVIYPSGEEKQEKFTSIYEARPMVYLVGSSVTTPPSDQFYSGEVKTNEVNTNSTP